ncbi:ABC transporter permease [Piscinibacter terrae]|uniref:Iron ABC transporter permease n=1 Tax=Piscinibacter terrae TaxID=2496871 RepID=A0A3N7K064_9BURK|nr:iron ABC transporter permease [Albitalea terrae]RQP24415.1 iron ABC transporter permease [Albitalea terrae]
MSIGFLERTQRAIYGWVLLGLAAYVILPWYFLDTKSLWAATPGLFSGEETANGLTHAALHGRAWLWAGFAGLLMAGSAALMPAGRRQGAFLIAGAVTGLIGVLASGFFIGVGGWAFGWPQVLWGALKHGQHGIGWGGFVVLVSLLMLLGGGIARMGYFRGDLFVASAVVACAALLVLFVAFPVCKMLLSAFYDEQGSLSVGALSERIATSRVWGLGCLSAGTTCGVAWNTVFLALLTAAGTTVLGTMIALLAERGSDRLRKPLNLMALLPIITPPFVVGLGLILLFGRAGIVNQLVANLLGITPTRWFYGWFGVWLAQLFAFTPIAFLIMRGVVQGVSPTLEEAAQTLRAGRMQTFWSVTLPLLKPGLANAFLVGFIESIADFGNPIVVGGQYSVLSTEIYFAIVGAQLDQGLAASLALILTFFALAVFFIQRNVLGKKSFTTVTGKGDAGLTMPLPRPVSLACHWVATPWLAFTMLVYVFAFAGGFVQTWGRDYTPTLDHFRTAFDIQWGEHGLMLAGTAWSSLITTVKLAAMASPLCAAIGLLISWLLARNEFRGQGAFEFGALLAFAIPGTVLGVSYILAFNVPPFELTGTAMIIVVCFIFRNLPVGVRAGTASFKQLDRSLDEASMMLRASTSTTLRRVVLPLLKPALVTALVYSFVRSMTTVSAVVFLVTAENELATTYIIGRVTNGAYGVALAYCTVLIVLMAATTALIQFLVGERKLGRRQAAAH